MIWILIAGAVAFLFWYSLLRPMNHFTKMGVKQSKPWPIVGDQWPFLLKRMSFAEVIEWIYNMYPKSRYVGFYRFQVPTLLLRDPELIKEITVKDFDHFTDHRSFIDPEIDPLWGGNLFSLKGQKWREMRATLSGSFTSSKMKHMFSLINEAAENFAEYFVGKGQDLVEVEMKDIFTRYTNDVIATSAFGIKVDSLKEQDNTFYMMGKKVTNLTGFVTRMKFILSLAAPALFRKLKISIFARDVSMFFRNIIHETINVREAKGIVRQDMINLLLETRKGIKNEESDVIETGFATVKESSALDKYKFKQLKQLSNDDITSQALIFFFAGFDTISTGLCFGSYELALNKEVQDKLRKEILDTQKATNGKLSYEVLLKMKYMDMVFTEILRKWPPVVGIDRVCTKPYTIKPVYPDEKPVHLKVGDLLLLPMKGIHRDPKYYPEPEKFDPERFSDENKDLIKPYTFIPFGAGPRNCIGSRFAILEAKAVLYHLLLNFEIVPIQKTRIPLKLCIKSVQPTAEVVSGLVCNVFTKN
nr:cytochrome P450 9Z214 [Pagiophloeus tsushimanus]